MSITLDAEISRVQVDIEAAQDRLDMLLGVRARISDYDAKLLTAQVKHNSDAAMILMLNARIAALEAAPPAVKWDWESDFAHGWTESGFMEQAKVPGRATLVTVGGKACVRLHTEPGDSNVAGSGDRLRNDLTTSQATTDGYAGREHHWEHSFLLPDDFVQPPMSPANAQPWHSILVFNFHHTTAGGGQANFQIPIYPATGADPGRPTGMCLELHHGNPMNPTMVRVAVQKGAITKNKWYDCQYEVRWAADATGFFKAWVDGVQYMDHKGPTLYAGQGVYAKLACYGTIPSTVIHTSVKRRKL